MTGKFPDTRQKLYLDVDGVFLVPTSLVDHDCPWGLPDDAEEFLDWALTGFDCYWLTSRDYRGDRGEIERAFRLSLQTLSLPSFLVNALERIEPNRWSRTKTSGIDLKSDFYWIDDAADEKAVVELSRLGLLERLVTVEVGLPSSGELTKARQQITDRMARWFAL